MASVPTYQSNPYADFDPSQWSNPYSLFQNQALPWPSSFTGWPTDASGRPIQPTPGMTLNSQPQQQAAAPAAAPSGVNTAALANLMASTEGPAGSYTWGNNQTGYRSPPNSAQLQQSLNRIFPQQQAAAAPAATPNPAGLSSQQYLMLRANPGQITTPGATVPQSANSAQPSPGVLAQFLQNWRPAQSGVGSGFQQGFANALKGMGY